MRRCDTSDSLRTPRSRERGIALLLVLFTTLALSAVTLAVLAATRSDTRVARTLVDVARARQLAEQGIDVAILSLLQPSPADRLSADGQPHNLSLPEGHVVVRVQNEAGKIDLNLTPAPVLRNFLGEYAAGDPTQLLEAILDWRTPERGRRAIPATDERYRDAGLAYLPPHQPFQTAAELRQVIGMTPQLFRRIEPFLTVYSRQRAIDPQTAARSVLLAVPGMSAATADTIIAERGAGDLQAVLPQLAAESLNYLRIRSGPAYSIRATAETPAGARFEQSAVVEITRAPSRPYRVLAWRGDGA